MADVWKAAMAPLCADLMRKAKGHHNIDSRAHDHEWLR